MYLSKTKLLNKLKIKLFAINNEKNIKIKKEEMIISKILNLEFLLTFRA